MIEKRIFGEIDGVEVPLYTLSNEAVEVELFPFGAALRALRVRDREGQFVDVALGYESLGPYQKKDGCLGGTIGRYANRIGGARFTLNGQEFLLTANEGENCLHGGSVGFHKRLFRVAAATEQFVTFAYVSPDREEGFPGKLSLRVTYRLLEDGLELCYEAVTDRDTLASFTNHTYFNLAGQHGGPVGDHLLQISAETYTPVGADLVPTGEIAPVEGTPLDFRTPAPLGERLSQPFLEPTRGFDHNFVLTPGATPAASLYCPRTGIGLKLTTDLPGMQLYSAGFLTERCGKEGAVYQPGDALCLETQFFPDAIHKPGFPSPLLRAGETYQKKTSWQFYTK